MPAVIIPYYQGTSFIHACIDSIRNTTDSQTVIYIVDNDPVPLNLTAERVTVIRSRANIGFGRAANIGAYRAMSDGFNELIITNQDVIFDEGTIAALLQFLSPQRTDIFLPMLKTYDLARLEEHFVKRILSRTSYNRDIESKSVPPVYSVDVGSAACIAVHANTVRKLGLFDPVFHMYGEDDDLFSRVLLNGGTLQVVTNAFVGHFHSLINAPETKRDEISSQQRVSADILRIRELPSRLAYLSSAFRSIFRTLIREGISTAIEDLKMYHAHFAKWKMLHSDDINSVTSRIKYSIKEDSGHE